MKKLQLGAFAFLSAALMVGCSSQTEKGEIEVVTEIQSPVQIEFWHSMSGALGESLTELVGKFNDTIGKEKGITVESVFQGGYTDAKSKVMAAIKSGESPAIVQGTSNDIQDYLLSGTVQPLNDYIFNEEVGIGDFDDIYNVYKEESLQYDGETYYSMPFSKSTDLLYYNKNNIHSIKFHNCHTRSTYPLPFHNHNNDNFQFPFSFLLNLFFNLPHQNTGIVNRTLKPNQWIRIIQTPIIVNKSIKKFFKYLINHLLKAYLKI